MKSSFFVGKIRHRRFKPKAHHFNYTMALLFLDLAKVDSIFRIPLLFSKTRAILRFRRSDYLGDATVPLQESVRRLIADRTGESHQGPIFLLTQIRYFGFCFNPVSFYYCYERDGTTLQYIVAEITNTPWGERHSYVLKCDENKQRQDFNFPKNFHVSPFLPMSMNYAWKFSQPGSWISVHMENFDPVDSVLVFDATLSLKQRELSLMSVVGVIVTFPLFTLKASLAIYWQALLLKCKGIPFYAHPNPKVRRTET